jgi:hypothetical protein
MNRSLFWISALVAIACTAPVSAQGPKPLEIDIAKGWTHELSGLSFPAAIGQIPYFRASAHVDGGWDNALQYNDKDGNNIVSVYIYQAAVQDIGVLFSESRKSIETRKDYFGTVTPLYSPTAFAPPGRSTLSGLRIVYSTDGQFPATALAIMPLGRDWVVKLRLSSKTKSTQELDAALTDAVKSLGWPSDSNAHPAAKETVACGSALHDLGEAKILKPNTAYALANALLAIDVADKKGEKTPPSPVYCRDESIKFPYSIYRPDNAADRYMISLGDSGKAVFVQPDQSRELRIKDGQVGGADAYSTSLVVPGSTSFYASFDLMPSPEQAIKSVNTTRRLSRTGRGGGDTNVEIDSSLSQPN